MINDFSRDNIENSIFTTTLIITESTSFNESSEDLKRFILLYIIFPIIGVLMIILLCLLLWCLMIHYNVIEATSLKKQNKNLPEINENEKKQKKIAVDSSAVSVDAKCKISPSSKIKQPIKQLKLQQINQSIKQNEIEEIQSKNKTKKSTLQQQDQNNDSINVRRSQLLNTVYQDLYGKRDNYVTQTMEANSDPKFIHRSYHQTTTTSSATSGLESKSSSLLHGSTDSQGIYFRF